MSSNNTADNGNGGGDAKKTSKRASLTSKDQILEKLEKEVDNDSKDPT